MSIHVNLEKIFSECLRWAEKGRFLSENKNLFGLSCVFGRLEGKANWCERGFVGEKVVDPTRCGALLYTNVLVSFPRSWGQ